MQLTTSLLAFAFLSFSAAAQGTCPGPDDAYENNDTCGAARTMASGVYPGLYAEIGDADFYKVTLQNMETLNVELNYSGSTNLQLSRYHSSCVLFETYSSNSFSYSNVNITGVPITVIFRVRVLPGGSQNCVNYDMTLTVDPRPDCSTPDYLEGGNSCAGATPVSDGFYPDLNITYATDDDFYAVSIDPASTLVIDVDHNPGVGSLKTYLWDPSIACGTGSAGYSGPFVARSTESASGQRLEYTNSTGTTQQFVVEVVHTGIGSCNEYDMTVAGTGSDTFSNYCQASPNSTGQSGEIRGSQLDLSARTFLIDVSRLPQNSLGIVMASRLDGFTSGVGSGNLCLSGAIGRRVGGRVLNGGSTGSDSVVAHMDQMPTPMGFVSVVSGETWYFQAWHRDTLPTGAPTSNFTDGLRVNFP